MELKEIAPYLVYKVKIWSCEKLPFGMGILFNGDFDQHTIELRTWNIQKVADGIFKPILYPLSDLTKPCLEGGGVPIVELAKLTEPSWNWKIEDGQAYYWKNERLEYWFGYNKEFESFDFHCSTNELEIIDKKPNSQLSLFNWLYEHHFWLGDQDRFGKDIIDINSLK